MATGAITWRSAAAIRCSGVGDGAMAVSAVLTAVRRVAVIVGATAVRGVGGTLAVAGAVRPTRSALVTTLAGAAMAERRSASTSAIRPSDCAAASDTTHSNPAVTRRPRRAIVLSFNVNRVGIVCTSARSSSQRDRLPCLRDRVAADDVHLTLDTDVVIQADVQDDANQIAA